MIDDKLALKKIRNYVIIALLLIVALFALIWFIQNSLYKITINGADSYEVSTVAKESNDRKPISSFFGYSVIPNDTSFIEVTSADLVSRKPITETSFIKPIETTIDIVPQKSVTKIGRESQGCNTVNKHGNFTYRCSLPDKIIKYASLKSGDWDNTIHQQIAPNFNRSESYQDGLLLMAYYGGSEGSPSDQLLFRYTIPGDTKHQDLITDKVVYTETDRLVLEADNSGGSSFLVNNITQSKLYFFKDIKSTPKVLDRKTYYSNKSDSIYCSLRGETLSCFIGNNFHSPDSDDEEMERIESNKKRDGAKGVIEQYNFTNDSVTSSSLGDLLLGGLCQSKDQLIGLDQQDLYIINTDEAKAKYYRISDDTNQISCGDNTLFSSADKLYYIDGLQAHLLFTSDRFNMSNIWSIGGKAGFNIFLSTQPGRASDGVSHAYTIDFDSEHTGDRIEDVLPYISDGKLPFFDMDYNDEVVYIIPRFIAISNHQTGRFEVDKDSYNDAKLQMEKQLESDSIDRFGRKLVFSTGQ